MNVSNLGSENFSQDAPSEDIQGTDITCYEFYENRNFDYFKGQLLKSEIIASKYTKQIFDDAFDEITEKYYQSLIPAHINDTMLDMAEIALESNFKEYDDDDMNYISEAFKEDIKQKPTPLDTWGRARLTTAEDRIIPDKLAGVIIPNYKDQAKKELRKANDRRKEFLFKVEEASLPEPIALDDKKDVKSIEDQKLRKKKLKEIDDKKKLDKKRKKEEEMKKKNAKIMSKNALGLKNNQRMTYTYDGEIVMVKGLPANKLQSTIVVPL